MLYWFYYEEDCHFETGSGTNSVTRNITWQKARKNKVEELKTGRHPDLGDFGEVLGVVIFGCCGVSRR